jgi:DNA-binding NarL/FixJ family response regulator
MSESNISNPHHGHGRRLSPRERKVLRLIAHGKTVAEIAAHLHRTEQEVQEHINNVLAGFGVATAGEALALAGPGPEEGETEPAAAAATDEPAASEPAAAAAQS